MPVTFEGGIEKERQRVVAAKAMGAYGWLLGPLYVDLGDEPHRFRLPEVRASAPPPYPCSSCHTASPPVPAGLAELCRASCWPTSQTGSCKTAAAA